MTSLPLEARLAEPRCRWRFSCTAGRIGLVCALSFAWLFAAPVWAADKPAKPNVIFILADDLGSAELGCYGQKKIRTPNLDRVAAEGMRFTQFYAGSPVCAPSRCCLMTGKHGGHAFIRNNSEVKPEGQTPIPDDEVTIAELFKKQGYATGAIGKWGLGPPGSTGDPLKQGFDLFFGYNCQRHAHNHYPTYLWRNDQRITLDGNDGGRTGKQFSHDLFEAEALKFIREHKDRPFFLYLPFTIPHLAIQVPDDSLAEYRGKWDDPPYDGKKGYQPHPAPRAGYAAMITRMDRSVGRILDLLRELKLDNNTLVMFSSDNGPTHGGVGGSDSVFFESAGPLRDWKGSVYEGGIRVPFLARWPGQIKSGTVSDLPAYFPDVMPTLMEIVGAAGSVPKDIDGLSFAPTLLGQPEKQRRHEYLFWDFTGYGGQQAVRLGDWKGVRRNLQKGPSKLELYNLKDDVGEQRDVADKHPEIVQRIETILRTARVPSKQFPLKGVDGR
jgi:arylsulfatase